MENYNKKNITEKITEENKIHTLEEEFNLACMAMAHVNITPRLLADFYELFIKAIKAKLNVEYYIYGTRLIFHATRLGVVDERFSNLARIFFTYDKLFQDPNMDISAAIEKGLVVDEIIRKNPYIGPDGKDTLVYPDKENYGGR